MPSVFKDFEKDVTDFFDKYHKKGAKGYKLESKSKGSDRTVYVNPAFEEDVFTVNFEYDIKANGLKTKLGFDNKNNATATVTLEQAGFGGDHKVELKDKVKVLNVFDYAGEFVHEWKINILPTPVNVYSKSKFSSAGCATDVMASADVPGVKGLAVGGSANIDCCKRTVSKQKVGVMYKGVNGSCSSVVAFNYNLTGVYSGGFVATLKGLLPQFDSIEVAAATSTDPKEKHTSFGLGLKCPYTGGNVRTKVGLAGNYGLQYFRSYPNNTTIGFGVEGKLSELSKCPADTLLFTVVRE